MPVIKFSPRQLPDSVIQASSVAGPSAWRFDATFVESPDGVRRFFTLADPFVDGKILTFKNGTKQIQEGPTPTVVYHPPNIVEFVAAPLTGAILESWYLVPNANEITNWVVDEPISGLKNNSNQIFTTFFPYVSGRLMLFANGVKLTKGLTLDYVEINPTTVQLNIPPKSTDFIEATYYILV